MTGQLAPAPFRHWWALGALALSAPAPASGAAQDAVIRPSATTAERQARHVVVVYDERTALPGLHTFDLGLSRALSERDAPEIEIYREDMDLSRFGTAEHLDHLRDLLAAKYREIPVDVVVGVMSPALEFVLANRASVFGGAPVVFAGVEPRELERLQPPPDATGLILRRHFAPTLELALHLHPGTERVVFVSGSSEFDRNLRDAAREELRPYAGRVDLRYLDGLPLDRILADVAALPPNAIVLYSTMFRDGAGEAFVPHEVVERIAFESAVPVYVFMDQYLGRGVVGGHVYGLDSHGEAAGRLVLRILGGEDPATIPPGEPDLSRPVFDAQVLARWGIPRALLPEDAELVFEEEPSFLAANQQMLLLAIAGLLIEGLIIAGLLFQRRERRRAETLLRENERRFRMLADRVPVMIWMTGPDGRFSFLNRSWLVFSGMAPEEQLDVPWTDRVHPEERERCEEALAQSGATGDDFSLECRMRRHDGQWRWVACNGVPRRSEDGELLGHVGTCFDVTRRKRAELANQRHAEELARVSRVATMGAFTASVAHELNQPLTAILSNAEAAARFLHRDEPLLEEVGEILGDIAKDGQRAGDIIRRMRSLLERHEINRTEIELNSLVCEVLALVRLEAMARRVSLEFEPLQLEVFAVGDRVHVQQVLMNLVLNAFEALEDMPRTGHRVVITTEATSEKFARISVADSGPGIPVDEMPHVFEPFHTTKAEGLGMGLSISRTIVEAHEGDLYAENRPGGGAAFHVLLPRTKALDEGPMRAASADA